ncbi:MAG: MATE family efflux transporter [Ruminococcus flavefaciens]|nr:MATE family efflux transporter [Ruminococcus flavefaciens]MCM1229243.1 MATE family efflux transporter [Ruminococcus flavefaciens]
MSEKNLLADSPVPKLMVKFAVPSIIGMLVSALYNIVDQLFIGKGVGVVGNSATNIAFPFSTMCIAVALLLGIGGASCFNLAMGRGDSKRAGYFAGNAVTMLILSGVVISAVTFAFLTPLLRLFGSTDSILPYAQDYVFVSAFGFPFLILTTGGGHIIRADGSPKMTMVCNLTGAVINTILDALFVLVFHWGMKGAALATVIGQVVSAVVVIVYMRKFKTVKLTADHFKPHFATVQRIASIGMASCFNQLAIMIVQIVLNNSLKHYGELSKYGTDEPIAVAGIVMKVAMIVFSIVIGLAQGTQPIESYNYGAKNYDRVKKAYVLALGTGAVVSVLAFVCFQLFPRQILSAFGSGTDTYFEFGTKFFRIFLFFTWLNCIQPISSTFFTSIGKPVKGIFLSLTRQIIFFIPVLIVLPMFIGIDGILYTGAVADLLAGIVAIIMTVIEFRMMSREMSTVNR